MPNNPTQPSPELWDAAIKGDATIYAHIRTWQSSGGDYTEMLEKLAIQLSKEKKTYFDMAVDATNMKTPDPIRVPGE